MVVELLLSYSYLILFLGVVAEGEIFPLAAGFLVSEGSMRLLPTLVIAFVGAFLGDLVWFGAARKWGRAFVDRFGRLLCLSTARVQWLEKHFAENGKKTLFITKFIYSFGHSSIIVAGVARMSWREFIKVDLPSSLLWAVLFVLLGKAFGGSFWLLKEALKDVAWAAVIVVGAVVLLQVYARRRLLKHV